MFNRFMGAFIMSIALLLTSCSSNAQTAEQPETYVVVKQNGVNLMSSPKADAKSIAPALMGEIYALTENPKDGYVKVRNIATSVEGYIDTMAVNHPQYPLTSPQLADGEVDEPLLINTETFEQGESVTGWDFWKAADGTIRVIENRSVAYTDGRARSNQFFYKAEAKDGYLLVTESVEDGGNEGTKLDTPIIIWQDIVDNAGVYIEGKLYAPNNPGGFDTDDWD